MKKAFGSRAWVKLSNRSSRVQYSVLMEKIRYTVFNTAVFTGEVWIDRYCVGT